MSRASRIEHAHTRVVIALLRRLDKPLIRFCEVGVLEASNAYYIARELPNCELWLVDQYEPVGNFHVHQEIGAWTHEQFSGAMLKAIGRMRRFSDRVRWIISGDLAAAERIPSGFFDMVFLDHLHDLDTMRLSLPKWYDKISTGGYFAGHDYGGTLDDYGVGGVKQAVDEFCDDRGLIVEIHSGHVWAVKCQ